jgi:uncharacterized alpha-E superfamily protein
MVSIERGQSLHLRACRGEKLTVEERADLDSWYAAMDAEEASILNSAESGSESADELRDQVSRAMADVKSTLERIEAIEKGNSELRRQNDDLRRVLVAKGILAA